jgi:methylmalonyl-CoA mutase
VQALFIVAGEEQGGAGQAAGTIQNDILKEFMVQHLHLSARSSMRIISDIFRSRREDAEVQLISISGYHTQEAGATADLSSLYTLADGVGYGARGRGGRPDIDAFAPRLSFFCHRHELLHGDRQDARRPPAVGQLIRRVRAQGCQVVALRTHCQTSGWSLTAQDVFNNVTRTTIEALAATHGGSQSLHTNALDEAIALPTDFSARIARNTQLFIQQETGTCRTIDPWGGSHYVERLTYDLARKAQVHIAEVEELGGMAKAIAAGIPRCASRRRRAHQARIDPDPDHRWCQQVPGDRPGPDRGAQGRQQICTRGPDR